MWVHLNERFMLIKEENWKEASAVAEMCHVMWQLKWKGNQGSSMKEEYGAVPEWGKQGSGVLWDQIC